MKIALRRRYTASMLSAAPPLRRLSREVAELTGLPPQRVERVLSPLRRGLVLGIHEVGGSAHRWSLGEHAPVEPAEIASVTKPLTAALLAVLAAQGQLDPHAPLRELGGVWRGWPAWVTLYALATHTAGLPAHPLRAGLTALLDWQDPYGRMDEAAVLASGQRWANRWQAGQFVYSNLGAGVLALALAQAAGAPSYPTALERAVLGPLNLRHTYFPSPTELPYRATRFGPLLGAGGLWSDVGDLLAFAQAHLSGALPPDWQLTVTPRRLPAGLDEVAPGWLVSGGLWWHDGVARHSRAGLAFRPATGRSVALLVAGGPGRLRRTALAEALKVLN